MDKIDPRKSAKIPNMATRAVRQGKVQSPTDKNGYDKFYRQFLEQEALGRKNRMAFSEAVLAIELEILDIIDQVRRSTNKKEYDAQFRRLNALERKLQGKFGNRQREYLKKQFTFARKLLTQEKKTLVEDIARQLKIKADTEAKAARQRAAEAQQKEEKRRNAARMAEETKQQRAKAKADQKARQEFERTQQKEEKKTQRDTERESKKSSRERQRAEKAKAASDKKAQAQAQKEAEEKRGRIRGGMSNAFSPAKKSLIRIKDRADAAIYGELGNDPVLTEAYDLSKDLAVAGASGLMKVGVGGAKSIGRGASKLLRSRKGKKDANSGDAEEFDSKASGFANKGEEKFRAEQKKQTDLLKSIDKNTGRSAKADEKSEDLQDKAYKDANRGQFTQEEFDFESGLKKKGEAFSVGKGGEEKKEGLLGKLLKGGFSLLEFLGLAEIVSFAGGAITKVGKGILFAGRTFVKALLLGAGAIRVIISALPGAVSAAMGLAPGLLRALPPVALGLYAVNAAKSTYDTIGKKEELAKEFGSSPTAAGIANILPDLTLGASNYLGTKKEVAQRLDASAGNFKTGLGIIGGKIGEQRDNFSRGLGVIGSTYDQGKANFGRGLDVIGGKIGEQKANFGRGVDVVKNKFGAGLSSVGSFLGLSPSEEQMNQEAILKNSEEISKLKDGLKNMSPSEVDAIKAQEQRIRDLEEENARLMNKALKEGWDIVALSEQMIGKMPSPRADQSSQQEVIRQQREKRKAPGYQAKKYSFAEGVGSLSAREESGGDPATISSGIGDYGGKSYGTYQLSSKTGTLGEFLETNKKYGDQFSGLTIGSPEFDAKWRDIAAKDPEFGAAQKEFIVQTHVGPQLEKLKEAGIDLSGRGPAVQELIYGTSTQYGPDTNAIKRVLEGKDLANMSDSDLISRVQQGKTDNLDRDFISSSQEVRNSVRNRIARDEKNLIAMAESPEGSKKTMIAGLQAEGLKSDQREANKDKAITSSSMIAPSSSTVNNYTSQQIVTGIRQMEPSFLREQDRTWTII